MPHDIVVTGLTLIDTKRTYTSEGNFSLAYFNCTANGFRFTGCRFVRTRKFGLTVWLPKLDGRDGEYRHVGFVDASIRTAMVAAVQKAYRAMGGTDGEWMPRDEQKPPSTDGIIG